MRWWRRIARQRWFQVALGTFAAEYLRFVFKTCRVTFDPPDIYARANADLPIILAMWHGQHLMMPFVRRPNDRSKVLISLHRDGEINAIAAERLGIETIRGSGAGGGRFDRKGGIGAFHAMVEALQDNYSVALTADVPKVARITGLGIVMLARKSGRPIYVAALATSRRYVADNWDHTTVNLPFSRLAAVSGEPIWVPADADEAAMEMYRREVEDKLNAATARAYAMVDGKDSGDPVNGRS